MTRILAIFKRDYLSYFRSPIGFVVLAIFMLLSGLYFSAGVLQSYQDMVGEIAFMQSFLFIVVPLLTMRTFAEDRKNGTEVLLLTSPASTVEIVLGKYLAALAMLGTLLAGTLLHLAVTLAYGGLIDFNVLGAYLGFLFLSAAFLAIGLFASATTENQIIAAVITFVVIIAMTLLDAIASMAGQMVTTVLAQLNVFGLADTRIDQAGQAVTQALQWLSPMSRITDLTNGIFALSPLVFLLSVAAAFLFLTNRLIEKRRWSQR